MRAQQPEDSTRLSRVRKGRANCQKHAGVLQLLCGGLESAAYFDAILSGSPDWAGPDRRNRRRLASLKWPSSEWASSRALASRLLYSRRIGTDCSKQNLWPDCRCLLDSFRSSLELLKKHFFRSSLELFGAVVDLDRLRKATLSLRGTWETTVDQLVQTAVRSKALTFPAEL